MSTSYEIHLDGVHAGDLSLGVLRDLTDLVVDGTIRATRLAVEGRSTARGIAPAWLAECCDVRLVGLREGSLILDVAARPLGELAPGIVVAATGPDAAVSPNETSLDLFMKALDDALNGRRDSDRLDYGMLQTFVKAKAFFGRGATRLRISRDGGLSVELTDADVSGFQKLAGDTPAPRVDRVVGVLDSLTVSTRTVVLALDDGLSLKGNVAANLDLGVVKGLLGAEVVFEGLVTFRPSARPLRIEIDHLAEATPRDVLWHRMPHGETGPQLLLPAESLSSSFGQWPGDEDDDQAFAALRELA